MSLVDRQYERSRSGVSGMNRMGSRFRRIALASWAGAAVAIGVLIPGLAGGSVTSGKQIGTFKVVGGHLRQSVQYLDSWKVAPSSQADCWTYLFKDQGGARVDLSFKPERTSLITTFQGRMFQFKNPLRVTGTGSRSWSTDIDSQRGPSGSDSCKNVRARPPRLPKSGCGTKSLDGAETGLWLSTRGSVTGAAALYGALLPNNGGQFDPCPSDSQYGVLVAQAWSPGGAGQLEHAKVGQTVKLGGKLTHNLWGHQQGAWLTPYLMGDWVGGSQLVHVDWSLTLKRVS